MEILAGLFKAKCLSLMDQVQAKARGNRYHQAWKTGCEAGAGR